MKCFSKTELSQAQIDGIKKNLMYRDPFDKNKKIFVAFKETPSAILVPKFFNNHGYSIAHSYNMPLSTGQLFHTDIKIDLRPLQIEALNAIIARLAGASVDCARGALLCMPCGYGKTRVAIAVAQSIGVKTLVLVATKFLAKQFESAIRKIFPTDDFKTGWLKKEKSEIPPVQIVFSTLQAIHKRKYQPEYLKDFGLVIVDEAHHVAADTYFSALCSLPMARFLGLTATPVRSDGRSSLVIHTCGPIAYECHAPLYSTLIVNCISYMQSETTLPPILRNPYKNITQRMQALVTLSNLGNRNRELVTHIVRLATSKTRNSTGILVLGKLHSHLEKLADATRLGLVSRENNSKIGFFTGRETTSGREYSSTECKIIFATYDMAKEGLDIPRLDTLVLSSPAESLIQCLGRIMRDFPGKSFPLVIEANDINIVALKNEFLNRIRKLKKIGAKVVEN